MSLERRGLTDHVNLNVVLINVHYKDNNDIFEKVEIPLSNLKFPQYSTSGTAPHRCENVEQLVACYM